MNDPIVLDGGSGIIKIGFGGEDSPRSCFKSIIGRPKYPLSMITREAQDSYIGDNAEKRRGILNLNYPIQRGVMKDVDDTMEIWEAAFKDINISTSGISLLATEHMNAPKKNSEAMIENMFERFNVENGYVAIPALLSAYSSAHCDALVLESGHGITQIFPVFNGHLIKEAVITSNIGGFDITSYLSGLIQQECGYRCNTTAEWEIANEIKEKHCFISHDFRQQAYDYQHKRCKQTFILPDGNEIKIGRSLFQAPELMFKPSLIGRESDGIADLLRKSIETVDVDLRGDLCNNIVLCGGNTMVSGFEQRLRLELSDLNNPISKKKSSCFQLSR